MPDTDIGSLFALDALELTKSDAAVDQIIDYLRQSRHLFNAGAKPKATAKKTQKLSDKLDTEGIDL